MSQRIWIQNITLHFVFCLVMSLCFSIAKMKLFCFPKYIYLYLLLSFCYSFLHLYRLKFPYMVVTAMHMLFCLLVLWILLLSLVWRYAALSPLVACLTLETFAQCRAKRTPRWLKQYLFVKYCISAIRFSCIDSCYWRRWRCHNWLERR